MARDLQLAPLPRLLPRWTPAPSTSEPRRRRPRWAVLLDALLGELARPSRRRPAAHLVLLFTLGAAALATAAPARPRPTGASPGPYARLVLAHRASPRVGIPFAVIVESFAARPLRGACPAITHQRLEGLVDPAGDFDRRDLYQVGRLARVEIFTRRGTPAADAQQAALDGMSPEVQRNLLGSLALKLDRGLDFYRRLLVASGATALLDRLPAVPRVLHLYPAGKPDEQQRFARGNERGVFLGTLMLLERHDLVITHELFHVLARVVLRADRPAGARVRTATALNEALADYFAAVASNQPRLPAGRTVRHHLTQAADGARLAAAGSHAESQLLSGLLWDLRRLEARGARARGEARAWSEISVVDRLALAAYLASDERAGDTVDLRGWIAALLEADRRVNGGQLAGEIRRAGARALGAPGRKS